MEKVIFIDRDGVINKDPGGWTEYSYVTKWEDFHFLPGVLDALKKLKNSGYKVIVISNQAGVSKGYFSKEALDQVTKKMIDAVKTGGGDIQAVYYCTHSSQDNCDCRKPKIGLFEKAKKELGVNPQGKYFIGDSTVDIEAGLKVGCKTIFLTTGKVSLEELKKTDAKPFRIEEGLKDAVDWIIKNE